LEIRTGNKSPNSGTNADGSAIEVKRDGGNLDHTDLRYTRGRVWYKRE